MSPRTPSSTPFQLHPTAPRSLPPPSHCSAPSPHCSRTPPLPHRHLRCPAHSIPLPHSPRSPHHPKPAPTPSPTPSPQPLHAHSHHHQLHSPESLHPPPPNHPPPPAPLHHHATRRCCLAHHRRPPAAGTRSQTPTPTASSTIPHTQGDSLHCRSQAPHHPDTSYSPHTPERLRRWRRRTGHPRRWPPRAAAAEA